MAETAATWSLCATTARSDRDEYRCLDGGDCRTGIVEGRLVGAPGLIHGSRGLGVAFECNDAFYFDRAPASVTLNTWFLPSRVTSTSTTSPALFLASAPM